MGLLVCAFLIIAPLIILYTAGYRYDISTRQFMTTGVLSIDVETEDVRVVVNDIVLSEKPPIRLPNLAPGLYRVDISSPGFHTWNNTVQIQSNQTTYIQDISLLKNRIPVGILYSNESTTLEQLSPNGTFLYYSKQYPTSTRHAIVDLKTTQNTTLFTLAPETTVEAMWSPFHAVLFFSSRNSSTSELAVVDANRPTSFATYRDVQLSELQWDVASPGLYGKVGEWIERFTPTEQELLHKPSSSLWWVSDAKTVFRYSTSTQQLSEGNNVVFLPFPITTILDVEKHMILAAQTTDATIHLFHRNGNTITDTEQIIADHWFFDTHTNSWYLWSQWEVWKISRTSAKVELLHRSSKPLRAVYPLSTNGSILFVTDTTLLVFDELYYSHKELFTAEEIRDVAVNKERKKIYIIGNISGQEGLFELDY